VRGRLISFEGLDGAGKTTQMDLLERWLEDGGCRDGACPHPISYIRTREPGGTPLGVEIRALLLQRPELEITPLAEALLFQADRAQHFATKIVPALDQGMLVMTDRCFDSAIAYQGAAGGMGIELVEQLSLLATGGIVPDLTFFLDLDPNLVHMRTGVSLGGDEGEEWGKPPQRERPTRFDQESEQFHQRLRMAFLALAQAHPQRIKVIDASQTPQQVHQQIISLLCPLLQKMRSSSSI
jgi:dTMP kinase